MAFRLGDFWLLTALMTLACQAEVTLPGVKVRVTKKALDYVNVVAHGKLASELRSLSIPDQTGREGRTEYSIRRIKNEGVIVPATSMTFAPSHRGLTWSMSNLGLSLSARWWARYKRGWFKISKAGNIDVDFRGVSLRVTIAIGSDSTGRPTVSMASCSASIDDVKVKFHGDLFSFILNLFKGKVGGEIKSIVRSKICRIIQKEVNIDGNRALSKLKVDVKLASNFLLDYGLIQAPKVMSSYLETEHKGVVTWIGDSLGVPFSPEPFPPSSQTSKMMYLWLSEYSANSWAFTAQVHDYLSIDLVAAEVDLHMNESNPKAELEARFNSTSDPYLTMSKEGVTLATTSSISLYANIPGLDPHFLVTISVNLSLSLQVSIEDARLVGRISNNTFDVTMDDTNVGEVPSDLLMYILNGGMKFYALPELDKLVAKGVDLPVSTGEVMFVNPEITHLDAINIMYK